MSGRVVAICSTSLGKVVHCFRTLRDQNGACILPASIYQRGRDGCKALESGNRVAREVNEAP